MSSIGLIYFVYLLAEKIKEGAGIFAGLFLSITPVFFYFSKVPLSDITSAFIATLALYFFLNRKDFIAGIFIGIAFLTRFPQGLILVPILISLLYRECGEGKFYFKRVFYLGLKLVMGFLILVVPYLISNYFLYGNFIKPLQYGNQIVSVYNFIYFKDFWYYVRELWATAPFLFFSIFSLIIIFIQFLKSSKKDVPLITIFITTLIFITYFFLQPHKELRYSIVFIPYISVLSGVGILWLLRKASLKNAFLVIFMIGVVFFLYKNKTYLTYREVDQYKEFYSFLIIRVGFIFLQPQFL